MPSYGSKTISAAVGRVRDGEDMKAVARSIGVDRMTVARWCANAGVVPAKSYRRWSDADERTFAELWDSGMTYREIGERMGRTAKAMTAYASKNRERFPKRPFGGVR